MEVVCDHSVVLLKLRIFLGEEKEIGCSSIRPVKILDTVCMVLVCGFFLLIAFLLNIHLGTQTLIYNAIAIILLSTHFLPSPLVASVLSCVFSNDSVMWLVL